MSMQTLRDIYSEHCGKISDKWSSYIEEYERIFEDFRNCEGQILEIGVQNGGSLEVWAKYFKNAAAIIGCDIDKRCENLTFSDPRIQVVVGDATSKEVAQGLIDCSKGPLAIVIEDGSHISKDIIKAFALYFPLLDDDGIFIAEDLHCCYWSSYDGGLFHPLSGLAFFLALPNIINNEHWGIAKSRSKFLERFFVGLGIEIEESVLAEIHSVEFMNSVCIVRKKKKEKNALGVRRITGTIANVNDAVSHLNGTCLVAPKQEENIYANRSETEMLEKLMIQVEEHAKEIALLREKVSKFQE